MYRKKEKNGNRFLSSQSENWAPNIFFFDSSIWWIGHTPNQLG